MNALSTLNVSTFFPGDPGDVQLDALYFAKLQEAVTTILNAQGEGDRFAMSDPKLSLIQNHPWSQGPDQRFPYPIVVIGEDEVRFDDATEVKYGGVQGVLLRFVDGDTIMTVRARVRGQGIGARLWREADSWSEPAEAGMWLPSQLSEEQAAFSVKLGLSPSHMALSGSVRWSASQQIRR